LVLFRRLIFCILLLPFSFVRAELARAPQAKACPLKTLAAWNSFIAGAMDNPGWVETCEDSTCDADFFADVDAKVQRVLEDCRPEIDKNEKIKSCTEHLRKFTPTWLRQHDATSYGFNVDNRNYLGSQDGEDKPPGMMKIPDAIVAALPDEKKVQEAARLNGWKYLTHDSALQGVRTFVVIQDPQGRFDQWMLLNLKSGKDTRVELNMPVSIVAVQKKNRDGTSLDQVRLHFRDYTLEEIEGSVKLGINENGNGKCFSCHASGMRQLIPRRTAALDAQPVRGEIGFGKPAPVDFAYWRLVELNQMIRRYGANDWNGMISLDSLGPMLGDKQGCTNCHNGISRGALTVATSVTQLGKKVVGELSMPPEPHLIRWLEQEEVGNPTLTVDEKRGLANAAHGNTKILKDFMDSRLPELKRWITSQSCL
jgi:hypothetical protein